MKRVIWSRAARRELERLNDWLGEQASDLPLTMTLRVEAEVRKLLDYPQLGTLVPDSNARKWRVRRTPYLLFFKPKPDGIHVLKVRHLRSDWKLGA